jgi:CelD/BcsL family acetyltransferase involved in cellulose biosynthesis
MTLSEQDNQDFQISTVTTEPEFLSLKAEWNSLWLESKQHFFSSWEWQWTWWRTYQSSLPHTKTLQILVFKATDSQKIVAILPYYTYRTRRLRQAAGCLGGLGEPHQATVYSEFLDLVSSTNLANNLLFQNHIINILKTKAALTLGILITNSFLLQTKMRLKKEGFIDESALMQTFSCNLKDGFEGYLALLSSNTRSQFRRLLKEADGNDLIVQKSSSVEESLAWFEKLVDYHQHDWKARGEPGAFHDARVTEFHKELIRVSTHPCLWQVRLSSQDLGYIYGFQVSGRFEWYQMGLSYEKNSIKRPGYTLHLALIRHLAQSGQAKKYDMLAGANQLKEQLSNCCVPVEYTTLYKKTLIYSLKKKIVPLLKKLKFK